MQRNARELDFSQSRSQTPQGPQSRTTSKNRPILPLHITIRHPLSHFSMHFCTVFGPKSVKGGLWAARGAEML